MARRPVSHQPSVQQSALLMNTAKTRMIVPSQVIILCTHILTYLTRIFLKRVVVLMLTVNPHQTHQSVKKMIQKRNLVRAQIRAALTAKKLNSAIWIKSARKDQRVKIQGPFSLLTFLLCSIIPFQNINRNGLQCVLLFFPCRFERAMHLQC